MAMGMGRGAWSRERRDKGEASLLFALRSLLRFLVLGSWCAVLGSWFLVLGSWFLVRRSWILVRRVFLVFITGVKALLQLDQLRLKGFHGLTD